MCDGLGIRLSRQINISLLGNHSWDIMQRRRNLVSKCFQLGFGSTSFSKTVCFTSIGFVKTEISKLWHFACCNHIMSTLFCFILDAYCMLLSQNMSPNLLSFQNQDFKFTSYSVFKVEYFLFFKCLFTCEGVRWKGRLPSFKGLFGLIIFFSWFYR